MLVVTKIVGPGTWQTKRVDILTTSRVLSRDNSRLYQDIDTGMSLLVADLQDIPAKQVSASGHYRPTTGDRGGA